MRRSSVSDRLYTLTGAYTRPWLGKPGPGY
jgi:hypothetical protein